MGHMASSQWFYSSAFVGKTHVAYSESLQLNLQPHYPGGNFVTLNMEAEQTG